MPLSPTIRRYTTYLLAWTAAGLFYVTQDSIPRLYRNEAVSWRYVFTGWMAAMYICAAFTPAMLWLGRRWQVEQGNRWRRAALHFGFSAAFSVVSSAIEAPVLIALGVFPAVDQTAGVTTAFSRLVVHGFHGGVIRYWAVIGLQAMFRSHELAAQLSAAQLGALKMQLQPHFLFNTLSAIMVLVRQQRGEAAETMLARLSDLLRLALDDVDAQEVPLWRELDFLRIYLSIQQVRFEDRLRVQVSADSQLSEALVPHMALQPIVENAVRHGLGESEDAVSIVVKASRMGKCLVLTVRDDGPGSSLSGFEGKGIGLANTRDRLQGLYGQAAALLVENVSPRGVQVTLRLPFHIGRAEDEECG